MGIQYDKTALLQTELFLIMRLTTKGDLLYLLQWLLPLTLASKAILGQIWSIFSLFDLENRSQGHLERSNLFPPNKLPPMKCLSLQPLCLIY